MSFEKVKTAISLISTSFCESNGSRSEYTQFPNVRFKNCVEIIAMAEGCACSCGNIRVRGQALPSGVYPNIPPSERPRLMACRSLLSVQPRCFQVRDVQRTASKQHSPTCTDFHCTNCNHVFRIFVTRMQAYVSKLPESAPLPQRTNGYPPALSPFITVAGPTQRQPREATEDADLDVMFSGEADPIVGSYRPHGQFPREPLRGPEAISRSYYA
jgi:hypothetical protein